MNWFSYLLLFNYVIPISLYVTLELQKFAGGILLSWDQAMYDERTDSRATARTTGVPLSRPAPLPRCGRGYAGAPQRRS